MYMKKKYCIHLNIASDIRLNFIAKILTRPQLENSVLERLEFPSDSNDCDAFTCVQLVTTIYPTRLDAPVVVE